MKYVPGPAFGQFSGSQGNTTASHNKFGAYTRSRTIPVNPNTSAQAQARGFFAQLSTAWRSLTPAQREDWIQLGAQMVRMDPLGVQYNLTGLQAFISVNQLRLFSGLNVVNDAPPLGTAPLISDLAATFSLALGGTHELTWNGTLGANDRLYVFATRPSSPGRNFFGPREHRLILISPPAQTSPLSILTEYAAKFPGAASGQKVSYRVKAINADFVSRIELTTTTIVQP